MSDHQRHNPNASPAVPPRLPPRGHTARRAGFKDRAVSPCQIRKCERQDLNLHGLPHWILSPARLPIPPLSQESIAHQVVTFHVRCQCRVPPQTQLMYERGGAMSLRSAPSFSSSLASFRRVLNSSGVVGLDCSLSRAVNCAVAPTPSAVRWFAVSERQVKRVRPPRWFFRHRRTVTPFRTMGRHEPGDRLIIRRRIKRRCRTGNVCVEWNRTI